MATTSTPTQQRVPDEREKRRVLKQVHHVFASGWQVVEERIVVSLIQVRALFERRDQRPEERTGADQRGGNGGEIDTHTSQPVTTDCPTPQGFDGRIGVDRGIDSRRCHSTSIRRTARKMRIAAASNSGNRNSATAAPWPMSPPSMPRKNAQDDSTCVEFVGPPRVST